jgi:hypothetical protein
VLVFSAIRETRAAQFDIFKSAPVRRQLQQAKLKSVDASHTRKLKLLRKQFVSETGRIDSVEWGFPLLLRAWQAKRRNPMLRHDAYSPEGWALERRNFNHVVQDFRYLAYH